MSEAQAATQSGATVIPFPAGRTRLDRALAALLQATQEQQEAVTAWRGSLADLNQAVSSLAGSVDSYRSALAKAALQVEELGVEAMRLDATCEAIDPTRAPSFGQNHC